ncbi:MAG: pirin family protein, partial [Patescibacteria group bacterium]
MEKVVHRSKDRGVGEHGWLSTRYSFSFANWYDPARMGFGALRVINDDTIAPAQGFGTHAHEDMEIITLVMSGTLTHEDSLGNRGSIPAGDVQTMSAGTGVQHSERNDSATEPLTLFQMWILPHTYDAP